jgi:HAD superfamily hydrolase (TIGR01509 family)
MGLRHALEGGSQNIPDRGMISLMTQDLQALLFDLDGTLADTEEAHRQAFNEAFTACDLSWEWDRALYKRLLSVSGGRERILAYAPALQRDVLAHLHKETIAQLHAEKSKRYRAKIASGQIKLRPGVAQLIAAAEADGLKLGLATTTSRANVKELLNAFFKGRNPFRVVVAGEDVQKKKPDPEIYLNALKALKVKPQHALAFEDSLPGLQSAKAAGLACVVTPTSWTEGGNFEEAVLVRPDLEGLSVADLSRLLA